MEALAIKPDSVDYQDLERLQARDDVITQFAELVDGSMRTVFEFTDDGNDLVGRDGRGLIATAEDSLRATKQLVKDYPELWFERRRRSHERDEVGEALQMMCGELGDTNTIIVISDYPEELLDAHEDIGGYNKTRKQTMLRVLVGRDGVLKMFSQSLDGSNRQALEAICNELGFQPQEGELLGQRTHKNLSEEEQDYIEDRLTGVYDRSMTAQHGGDWYAGRRPADYRNTYNFVCQQHDLIKIGEDLKLSGQLTDHAMYDLAATMQKRFKTDKEGIISLTPRLIAINPENLQQEIVQAGREARQRGDSFSACGDTLRPTGGDPSLESDLQQAGYGDKDGDCEFISKRCPECNAKNVKTKSRKVNGKTHVSGSCGCSKVY